MATSTLSQQPIVLNDTPVEPLKTTKRRDLHTDVHYVTPTLSQEQLNADKSFGSDQFSYGHLGRNVPTTIEDVADGGSGFSLSKEGFTYAKHTSALSGKDFEDEEKLRSVYYPETAELVKKLTGASKVLCFNSIIRTSRGSHPPQRKSLNEKGSQARRAHVDLTNKVVIDNIRAHITDEREVEELLKKRHQLLNVWRPIKPILRDPFGVADLSTARPEDIVVVPILMNGIPHTNVLGVRASEKLRWYYKYHQQPDEPLLFSQFDSKIGGHGFGRVPHSAFLDEEYEQENPRESIEARVMVFYDEPGMEYPYDM